MLKLHGIEYEYKDGYWYYKEDHTKVNDETLRRTLSTIWFDGVKQKKNY